MRCRLFSFHHLGALVTLLSLIPAPAIVTPQAKTPLRPTPPVVVLAPEPAPAWKNAVMGGVEYATGLVWSRKHPESLFLRADGGGVWRLDRTTNHRWINLSDNMPWKWGELVTADSVAVDPDNPQTLYVASGGGRWSQTGDVMKTINGGKTWARTSCINSEGKNVVADGNGADKQAGERLVCDPNRGQTLLYATRNDGLMRSDDAAKTWRGVSSFPAQGASWNGLTFVAWDETSGVPGKNTPVVYVGVHAGTIEGGVRKGNASGGVFRSNDNGKTWEPLKSGDGTASPLRGKVSQNGTLYVTFAGNTGQGVYKCERGATILQNITPPSAKNAPFCGINLHPTDASKIVAAQTYGDGKNSTFYYSADAGLTWKTYRYEEGNQPGASLVLDFSPEWEKGPTQKWGGNASEVAFDPLYPNQIWHLSFSGPCRGTGVGSEKMHFSLVGDGREQMTCADAISPSSGAPLISGVWDVGGFRHENLTQIPARVIPLMPRAGGGNWGETAYQDAFQMDASPQMPDNLVVAGGWQWNNTGDAAYSDDNGRTLHEFSAKPFPDAKFGRIAVSAANPDNVVWLPMGDKQTPVYTTQDKGRTWQAAHGTPLGMIATDGPWSFYKCLAADRISPSTFYLYDRVGGGFFRSSDGGSQWQKTADLPTQAGVHFDWHRVLCAPDKAGDVWLALQNEGLLHSPDGGTTWEKLSGVAWAQNITWGKGKPGGKNAALYLFGQIGGLPTAPQKQSEVNAALYRSDDRGRTWTRINDDAHQFPNIAAGFAGDMQTWGRVFVTTGTRGIFYNELATAGKSGGKKKKQ